MFHYIYSGNGNVVHTTSVLFNLWAVPWAEAASVGKSSVQSGQSERYIQSYKKSFGNDKPKLF